MSSTSVQQLREIAESMGLKGPELMNFVRDQHILEREEREREKQRQDKEKEGEQLERMRLFEIEKAKLS